MIELRVAIAAQDSAGGTPTVADEIAAGRTVVCPACGVRGVVESVGTGWERLTCHTPLETARPVRCGNVPPRDNHDRMVTGRRYQDVASGFTVRCTWGGPGRIMVDGRALRLARSDDGAVHPDSAS